jgi:hypothetical protein
MVAVPAARWCRLDASLHLTRQVICQRNDVTDLTWTVQEFDLGRPSRHRQVCEVYYYTLGSRASTSWSKNKGRSNISIPADTDNKLDMQKTIITYNMGK